MFDRLKTLFGAGADPAQPPDEKVSIALLLLELARSDFDIAEAERARIEQLLSARYRLDPAQARTLMDQAQQRAEETISLYDYVRALNQGLDAEGKRELLRMLWEVAYADGRLDKYEEYLLRKLVDLLYIPEQDYIRVKLSVMEQQRAAG